MFGKQCIHVRTYIYIKYKLCLCGQTNLIYTHTCTTFIHGMPKYPDILFINEKPQDWEVDYIHTCIMCNSCVQ